MCYMTSRALEILAFAAIHCLTIHQLDVESAFMCASLQEDVYMHAHPAMNIPHG